MIGCQRESVQTNECVHSVPRPERWSRLDGITLVNVRNKRPGCGISILKYDRHLGFYILNFHILRIKRFRRSLMIEIENMWICVWAENNDSNLARGAIFSDSPICKLSPGAVVSAVSSLATSASISVKKQDLDTFERFWPMPVGKNQNKIDETNMAFKQFEMLILIRKKYQDRCRKVSAVSAPGPHSSSHQQRTTCCSWLKFADLLRQIAFGNAIYTRFAVLFSRLYLCCIINCVYCK